MKRIFIILPLMLSAFAGFSQLKFQGTTVAGPTPNSVDVVIRPTVAFNGYLSNLIFVLQVPTTAVPLPTITVTPLATNFSTSTFNQVTDAATNVGTPGYSNYGISANNSNITNIAIGAGAAYPVARLTFTGGPVISTAIRLAHLVNGGASTQFQFYIEASSGGTAAGDYTNYVQMFYGASAIPAIPVASELLGYSTYQYSQINAVLPVKWLNFTAVRQVNDAQVSWTVDNDQDNEKYVIERSLDGSNFNPVTEVFKRAGTGSKQYSFLDRNITSLGSKIIYYRIKNIEINNKFSYTETKNIRLDVKGETALFPNPAKDGFTLNVPYLNPDQKRIQLHLVNGLGQIMERKDITRAAATNYYYSVQSPSISSGEYLLKIYEDGQLTETKRLLVKK